MKIIKDVSQEQVLRFMWMQQMICCLTGDRADVLIAWKPDCFTLVKANVVSGCFVSTSWSADPSHPPTFIPHADSDDTAVLKLRDFIESLPEQA